MHARCTMTVSTVYVMGGHCSQDSSNKVEKYKFGWDEWEEIDNMPTQMTS